MFVKSMPMTYTTESITEKRADRSHVTGSLTSASGYLLPHGRPQVSVETHEGRQEERNGRGVPGGDILGHFNRPYTGPRAQIQYSRRAMVRYERRPMQFIFARDEEELVKDIQPVFLLLRRTVRQSQKPTSSPRHDGLTSSHGYM